MSFYPRQIMSNSKLVRTSLNGITDTIRISTDFTYRLRTACIDTKRAGTLNVSKKISAAFSLFRLGFRGASVSSTGCCKGKVM
jgi:hypothetical protein